MVLKGYRLWVMGQLDSNVQSPTVTCSTACKHVCAVSDAPASVAVSATMRL
jgi:hypothetical protein